MTGIPLVRVVVVNYNGGAMTLRCLRSLEATRWPVHRLELVLVDNASDDGVAELVRREHPRVRVVEAGANLGFGGACNLGFEDLGDVDQVALVNNDATVAEDWLDPLVAALTKDKGLGAACPKILFDAAFLAVELTAPATAAGWGDRRQLGVRVCGLRVAGEDRWRQAQPVAGFWEPERGDEGTFQWTGPRATLLVPVPVPAAVPVPVPVPVPVAELCLASDVDAKAVELRSDGTSMDAVVGRTPTWVRLPLDGPVFDLINNVGTDLVAGSFGADRGFREIDRGQYDESEDVFAWCGGAVLLSRRYLDDVGHFDERLFLYYEDLDLAWRGRSRGWRYRYVPGSVVRHIHSATSDERSAMFAFYNERNRLLTSARNAPWRAAVNVSLRSLLVTASYARRDVLSPLLRKNRPHWSIVTVRLRAFGSYLRLLPGTVRLRRARSSSSTST